MTLAEAIRRGAQIRPMCTSAYFAYEGGRLCSDALGAAYEAVCGLPRDAWKLGPYRPTLESDLVEEVERGLFRAFPELIEDHPQGVSELYFDIIYANDYEGLTREEIALGLEGLLSEE